LIALQLQKGYTGFVEICWRTWDSVEEQRMKKIKVFCVIICSLFPIFLMTGCKGDNENIAEGMKYVAELDYTAALECFAEAEDEGEDAKLLARGRGIAYMGMTRYEEAIECFLEALSHSNGIVEDVDYDINLYLAAVYTKTGQYAEAEEIYNAVLAMRPKEVEVLFLRGSVRLNQGNYEGAKEDMDKVVEMDGKNFERIIHIYEIMEAGGYKDSGQGYLTDALQTYEKDMSNFEKGRMLFYMGEYKKAYIALEEAKNEGGVEAYLYLGRAYEATGDYNYAESVYNSYLTKVGEDARVYNQLGLCEARKGEYEEALKSFQAGLDEDDPSVRQVLLFNEIVAYEHLGEFEKAATLMKEYLAVYPDDELAEREYEFLSTR